MIQNKIKQFVAWGHKLHSHTHSYIHGAFIKAFQHLGYKTLWLDDSDDISGIDFEGTLFLTEGQVDSKIPLKDDCFYLLHYPRDSKYTCINKKNIIYLYVHRQPIFDNNTDCIPIPNNKFCFFNNNNILVIPWATDLLPNEINNNINKVKNGEINSKNRILNFIGMPLHEWDLVFKYCKNNNIQYKQVGGFSQNNVNYNENMHLIQQSIIAPAVQCQLQLDERYIPCRIFKNISYGKMGMTNNPLVSDLFDNKILYNSNIDELLKLGLEFENKTLEEKNNILIPLMEYVKDSHTYLNRIELIFWYFNEILEHKN